MKILQDTFPAFVSIDRAETTPADTLTAGPPTPGARQVNTARVVVTDTEVIAFVDGNQGPVTVYRQPYTFGQFYKNPDRTKESFVTTDSGDSVAFRYDQACGCGSRLRGFNPFNVIDSSKDPS